MGEKTARLYIRVDPEWLDEVRLAALALGLDVSAYVTLAVSERMRRDQQEVARATPKPQPRKK